MRSIKKIVQAEKVNMGGIYLDQALPVKEIDQISPFLLIHHWKDELKEGGDQKNLGVGPHPHRGFSPVTFIFKGGVHHRDSRGNDSIVMEGGVQWMHAGMGITHSERPPKELAEKGGAFEIIQFWLNVPSKNKMVQPVYYPLYQKDIPVYTSEDHKVKVSVVAGEFKNVKGKIETFTPVTVLRFDFEEKGKIKFQIPENQNTLNYLLDGELIINGTASGGEKVKGKDLVWFENEKGEIELEAIKTTRAILLAGEPLNEPLATYGPFVMNTQTEIMEALRDTQLGKMGVLIEKF